MGAGLMATASCSKNDPEIDGNPVPPVPPETAVVPTTEYDVTQLNYCTLFDNTPEVTQLQQQQDNELSGIASSRLNPGILYMHSDSRNAPVRITNAAGETLGSIILDGQTTLDPEDISVGPGPETGKYYIYLADIGDNNRSRQSVTVYRFEEPLLSRPDAATEIHIGTVAKLVLNYPEAVYNAETLLVDPLTGDLLVATKEVNRSTLYRAPFPQSETAANVLEPVLHMRFFDLLTSGDISADGREIVLRNKSQVWYWPRDLQAGIAETLLTPPLRAPYAGNEHQGEGIGFAADGSGYFTNTETRDYPGAVSTLSFYVRK